MHILSGLLILELLFHLARARLKNSFQKQGYVNLICQIWNDQRMISMWAQNEVSTPSMLEYLALNQCARKDFLGPKKCFLQPTLFRTYHQPKMKFQALTLWFNIFPHLF